MKKIKTLIKSLLDKYSQMSKPAKAALWFTFCSLMQRGLSFITTPIFTRTMSQTEFGTVGVFNSWMNILTIVVTLELATGVFNRAMIKFPDDKDGYTASSLTLSMLSVTVFFLIYFVFRKPINKIATFSTEFMIIMFAEIFFSMALSLWSIRKRFDYEYRPIVVVTMVKSITTTVLSLIFVLNAKENQAFYKILGGLIVTVILGILMTILIYRKSPKVAEPIYWKYALWYNIPLIPHYLSQQVLNQSDKVMISKMCSKADVAVYDVAYQVAIISLLFINAINSSLSPWFMQMMKEENYAAIKKRSLQLTAFIGVACLMFPLFAPEVIWILGGKEYLRAVYIVPPVAMSVLFITIYTFFSNVQFYFEKTKYVMVASCIAAGLNIVLNYVFIKKYGFVAAGYTTLFCYILYALVHCLFMQKVSRDNHISVPFNYKVMWVIGLGFSVISILMSFSYKTYVIRYILILVLGAGLGWYLKKHRKELFQK